MRIEIPRNAVFGLGQSSHRFDSQRDRDRLVILPMPIWEAAYLRRQSAKLGGNWQV